MTAVGVCRTSDAIGHIPIKQEYRRPDDQAATTAGDGSFDELGPLPISISNVIGTDSIGVKIDPVTLFSGQVRVLLRDETHASIKPAARLSLTRTHGARLCSSSTEPNPQDCFLCYR